MDKKPLWFENIVFQNVLVWIFVLAISSITVTGKWYVNIGIIVFLGIPIYINNLKIQPFLYARSKTKWLVLFLVNISFFSILGGFALGLASENFEARMFYSAFGFLLLMVSFGGALKMARDGFIRRQQMKEAELNLLKAQMNPHFLFNTLNNLYGLSVTKSDKLPELMLKLSELLRYNLYETHDTTVLLEKEIDYLKNYVALEQIRLENDTKITFEVKDDVGEFKIAPMVLITFIENGFKHIGTNEKNEKFVTVKIEVINDHVYLTCKNSVASKHNENNLETPNNGGLGLKNTTKRLQFMYPGLHNLHVESTELSYSVELKLKKL